MELLSLVVLVLALLPAQVQAQACPPGQTWVRGHYLPDARWVPGQCQSVPATTALPGQLPPSQAQPTTLPGNLTPGVAGSSVAVGGGRTGTMPSELGTLLTQLGTGATVPGGTAGVGGATLPPRAPAAVASAPAAQPGPQPPPPTRSAMPGVPSETGPDSFRGGAPLVTGWLDVRYLEDSHRSARDTFGGR